MGVKAAVVECLRVLRAHRSWLVLLALMVALAALLVWLSSPRSIEESDPSPRSVAEGVRSEPLPDPLVAAASEQAVPDPSPVASGPAIEKVEVCGVGWVDADADGAVDTEAILASAPMVEAAARLLESIRGDDDFGAATALVLQPRSPGEGSLPLFSITATCAAGPCDATNQDRAAAASLVDRIVKVASATTDPRAYSLALEICAWQIGEGPCTGLTAAQWARLDPDNGAPWLYILDRAFIRHDESAIDDALFHIGAASRLDGHFLAESRLFAQHAGAAPSDLLVAGELSTRAAVMRPMGVSGGISAADKSCSYGALSDPNRKELCEKVATAFQDRSSSLMTMGIGSAIGRRLGWADERFETADAIMAARSDSYPLVFKPIDESRPAASLRQPLDCASIRKVLRYVDDVATRGEREHARLWIERSGKAEHYVRLGREQHARIVAREAAEAAQRASAPAR